MAKERRDNKNRILQKGEYQKDDGRYMYRYVDSNGCSRFVYSWTLTQTDRTPKGKKQGKCLRELEKDIAKDLLDGINTFNANKNTLNDLFERYISDRNGLRRNTYVHYLYLYDRYVRGSFGKRKIATIKYSDVKEFYISCHLDIGLKFGSLQIIHAIIMTIMKNAVRDELIRYNPATEAFAEVCEQFELRHEERYPLTIQEQSVFIDFLSNDPVYGKWLPMILVFLNTGCRIGELSALTWDDCDFENGVISINKSLSYGKDPDLNRFVFHINAPKTKSGIRKIPMLDTVRRILLDEKNRQEEKSIVSPTVDDYTNFVFLNRNSNLHTQIAINGAISGAVKKYNLTESILAQKENREPYLLPHFSAHNLRHTFCTRLCEANVNVKVIQEIMGHANFNLTMNTYTKITDQKKSDAFTELSERLQIY